MRAATTTQSHAMIPSIVGSLDAHIREQLAAFVNALSGEAISLVSLSALIIAVPATSIYMLLEAHAARRFFLAMLPHAHRRRADAIIMQVDAVLGGFIRGQVLVAIVVAIMVTAMLLLLRVPYAVLIGVWAGVLDVVPYLGAAAGAIPGVAIAFLSNGVLDAVLVSFGFAAIFELEGNLIAPKIVSRTVGISPLTVVFAVIVGGEIFGPTGMLIAVPVAGVIRVVIENVRPAPLP
jgi:predicted PurR-regulated permease PerM